MENEIEILKTGTHTDNSGKQYTYTEKDLDDIVSKYDTKKYIAPIVVGHPKTDSPAYGWIESLRRSGSSLMAIPTQVNEDFKNMIRNGAYKTHSAAVYVGGSLKHLGFLGGAAPAIKGLKLASFSDTQEFTEFESPVSSVIFAETEDKEKYEPFLKKLKEILLNDFFPFMKSKNQDIDKTVNNYNEDEKMEQEKINELTAKVESLTKDVASFSEKIVEKDKTIQELQTAIQKTKDESLIAGFSDFCETLVAEGKMKPADKDKHIKALTNLSKVANFSDSEDNPIQNYKDILKNSPVVMDFSESQLPSFDSSMDAKSIHAKAVEYAESHKVTVLDAIDIITKTQEK